MHEVKPVLREHHVWHILHALEVFLDMVLLGAVRHGRVGYVEAVPLPTREGHMLHPVREYPCQGIG